MPTETCFEINPLVSFYQICLQHSLEIVFKLPKASDEPVHSYEAKSKNSAHELFIEYEAKQCDKGQMKAFNERLLFIPSHMVFTCNLFFTIQFSREIKSLDNSLFLVRKEPFSISLPFLIRLLAAVAVWEVLFAEVSAGASTFLAGAGRIGDQRLPQGAFCAWHWKTLCCPGQNAEFWLMSPRCLGQQDKDLSPLKLWHLKAVLEEDKREANLSNCFCVPSPTEYKCLCSLSVPFCSQCKEQRTLLSWEFINWASSRYILDIFLSILVSSSWVSVLRLQGPPLSNSDLVKKEHLTWVPVCGLAPTPYSTLSEM